MNESKLAEMKISNKLLEELLIRSFGSLSVSYENGKEKPRMDFFTSGLPKDFKIVKMEAEQDQLSIIFKSESNKDFDDNEKIPERYFTMSTRLMNCFTCKFIENNISKVYFYCTSLKKFLEEDPHSFFCANHKFKKGE